MLPDPNSWTSKELSQRMSRGCKKLGMTTLVIDESSLRAVGAQLTDEALVVDLVDGRSVSVPLVWVGPRITSDPVKSLSNRDLAWRLLTLIGAEKGSRLRR